MPPNRGPQPNINAAPTLNPNVTSQNLQAGLTRRMVKKFGRGVVKSGLAVGRGIKQDVKQTAYEFTHPRLGIIDMALAGLLVGVPVGAAYSAVKLPEWIHAGRQWFEKNVIKISDEIEDILFLKTFEGYAVAAPWVRQFMGAEKAKK